jgi:hypothetical protein
MEVTTKIVIKKTPLAVKRGLQLLQESKEQAVLCSDEQKRQKREEKTAQKQDLTASLA